MDKVDNVLSNYNHGISLADRKNVLVSGVKKIENFDDQEFLMETTMGPLLVKGEELELIKLDTMQGNVSIKGKIIGMDYIDEPKSKEKESIINRLFK
ncbi:MAG: sporulation protein YabP [Bacilli bacterium]|nr:sporulation protein YabP [Bacilli bacterium]